MTADLQTSPLATLKALGLINADHYRRALAHPHIAELAEYSDLPRHLVWLVSRDIMTEDELKQACVYVAATYTGAELEQHNKVLGTALVMLDEARKGFNQQWFDTLVSENLITSAERDRAMDVMSPDDLLASPAAALAWMALADVITGERLDEIRATAGTGSAERAAILTEAEDIFARTNAAVSSKAISAIFPGPRWMWKAAPVLFVGFLVWTFVKPASVPSCTDSDVTRTLNAMMFSAGLDARINARMSGMMDTPASSPTVHAIREVGFATEPRIRGCVAKLKIEDTEISYAFTIARSATDKGEYAVVGAEPAMVEARFGHLDNDGKFLHKAEPLGRAEVERAFRAGFEGLNASGRSIAHILKPASAIRNTAPERTREIAEIEPMAPCREVKPGTVYSCRLLIERNDTMLAAIGRNSTTMIDSEFTFQRDSATGPWRVSDGFNEEFMKAVVGGRLKSIGR